MKNKLELYIAEKLKIIDKYARPTKASGASTEIGDIYSSKFHIECKQRNTKNVTIVKSVWDKLLKSQPINTDKVPLYVLENKFGNKWVVLDIEDFFRILYEIR